MWILSGFNYGAKCMIVDPMPSRQQTLVVICAAVINLNVNK